jgi:hypothetical protein
LFFHKTLHEISTFTSRWMIQDVKFLIINVSYFFHLLLVKPFVTYLHYFLGSIATTIFMWAFSLFNEWMDELCIRVWASRSWHKKFTFKHMN